MCYLPICTNFLSSYWDCADDHEELDFSFTYTDEIDDCAEDSGAYMDKSSMIKDKKAIVFMGPLAALVKRAYGSHCAYCNKKLNYALRTEGTAVIFSWKCPSGNSQHHSNGNWESQPKISGMFSGNLLVASNILISGNMFAKLALFAKHMNMHFIGKSSFYRYQKCLLAPAIQRYWLSMQKQLFADLKGQELTLAGDGRMDSPGHSAMYCSYVFADYNSKKILSVSNIDVRETQGKSTNMELLGFQKSLQNLKAVSTENKVVIKEVITDGHLGIAFEMAKEHKDITHSLDTWHGGKNLMKKIVKAGKWKDTKSLLALAPHVRNHFWFSCQSSKGDMKYLKGLWFSLLNHVRDIHEWEVDNGAGLACLHEPSSGEQRDYPYLTTTSKAFQALKSVVLDPKLLSKMHHFKNFRHTGFLESFMNLILKYAPKRHSFGYEGYITRVLLAAIDHNSHIDREPAYRKDGNPKYSVYISRRSKVWFAVPVLEDKGYLYVEELLMLILETRENFHGNMSAAVPLHPSHPKTIHPSRMMVNRPAKDVLIAEHQTRF